MNKKQSIRKISILSGILQFLLFVNIFAKSQKSDNYAFQTGEKLKYRVHYGLITGGYVDMYVDKNIVTINNKECYKIVVCGKTPTILSKILDIRNYFCSYMTTDNLQTQIFLRKVKENNYTKNDEAYFDYKNNKVTVKEFLKDKTTKTKVFDIPNDIQDVISKWYIYRNFDFNKMTKSTIIDSKVFFDNSIYQHFAAKYLGKQTIDTELGKMNVLVIAPKIPFGTDGKKTVFDGEDSVMLYLSDDENKIPVKINLKLFVGSVEIDIMECNNLKYALTSLVNKK